MPEGSVGRGLAQYLVENHLNPDDLPVRPAENDYEYILAHLYETHDLWHVLTGFKTDVAGELGLQAFYLAQGPYMLAVLLLAIGMLNTLLFAREDYTGRMEAITRGWKMGKQARMLFGQPWNEFLPRPLAEARTALGLT
jgi:ubiquinone biosynthesis protein Coq4